MSSHSLNSPETERTVKLLLQAGYSPRSVAAALDITLLDLRNHYTHLLAGAKAEMDALVVEKLIEKIERGDRATLIFYAKSRMGWSDSSPQPTEGEEASKGPKPLVVQPFSQQKLEEAKDQAADERERLKGFKH